MGKYFKSTQVLAVIAAMLTACSDHSAYQMQPEPEPEPEAPAAPGKTYNDFDFSTTTDNITLNVDYKLSTQTGVYFEIYDQEPGAFVSEGNSYILKEGVEPLLTAMTDDNGHFSRTISLPSYVKKLYVYSPAFFAPRIIEAEMNGQTATAYYDHQAGATKVRSVYTTDVEHDTKMITAVNDTKNYPDAPWKDWLGTYDKKRNGYVNYRYEGSLAIKDHADLLATHQLVINVANKNCPKEYRSAADFAITEDAEVAITFLGGVTCWSSSLGYYYYKEGEKPTSLNKNVVMIFPNTQNGEKDSNWNAAKQGGINNGDCVQLLFYPHLDEDSKEGATTVFPAGYRIGLVLATNAWTNRVSNDYGNVDKRYRAATSNGLSVNNNGSVYNVPRTAAYRYDGHVIVSFEDHTDDQNFSDVVVTLKSNPVKAIEVPGLPEDIGKEELFAYTEELTGIYAFEDLWPKRGDYDMNDVIVKLSHGKKLAKNNLIYAERAIFKTFENYAVNNNGLAARLEGLQTTDKVKLYMRKSGETEFTEMECNYDSKDKVVLVTDNVKQFKGAEYMVEVEYATPTSKDKLKVTPFIYRDEDGGRWEVHLPYDKPTSKVNKALFDTDDDASDPASGRYYVRDGNYPFAIFLAGATEADLSKLLDNTNERRPIDQLYPKYTKWVDSKGGSNMDWYK